MAAGTVRDVRSWSLPVPFTGRTPASVVVAETAVRPVVDVPPCRRPLRRPVQQALLLDERGGLERHDFLVAQKLPPLVLCRPFKRGQRRADPDTLQVRVAPGSPRYLLGRDGAAASTVTANRENLHPPLIAYLRQITRQRLPVAGRFNHAGRKKRDPTRESGHLCRTAFERPSQTMNPVPPWACLRRGGIMSTAWGNPIPVNTGRAKLTDRPLLDAQPDLRTDAPEQTSWRSGPARTRVMAPDHHSPSPSSCRARRRDARCRTPPSVRPSRSASSTRRRPPCS